jgi:hypothetical protein
MKTTVITYELSDDTDDAEAFPRIKKKTLLTLDRAERNVLIEAVNGLFDDYVARHKPEQLIGLMQVVLGQAKTITIEVEVP